MFVVVTLSIVEGFLVNRILLLLFRAGAKLIIKVFAVFCLPQISLINTDYIHRNN